MCYKLCTGCNSQYLISRLQEYKGQLLCDFHYKETRKKYRMECCCVCREWFPKKKMVSDGSNMSEYFTCVECHSKHKYSCDICYKVGLPDEFKVISHGYGRLSDCYCFSCLPTKWSRIWSEITKYYIE